MIRPQQCPLTACFPPRRRTWAISGSDPLRTSSSIACRNAQVQGRGLSRSKTDMALPPRREKLLVDDSGWRWAISPSLPRVGGLNFRRRPATSQPWKMDMGSINFPVASMFGTLSDVVGTKSGLALNRQQLAELLGRDERFQEFQALSDDGLVRIHSSLAEEMIEFLLFSVGRLERINNPLPIASLVHKYKKRPAKLKIVYALSEEFLGFLEKTLSNSDLKPGDKIDPSPFMLKCLKEHGRLGLEISNDLITNYAIQLELKSWHLPNVSEWTDIAELNDMFCSEGLTSQYGSFF